MANIVWLPSMSVGIDKWDADHRVMLELINRLDGALHQERFDSATVARAIDTLVAYAEVHFLIEEQAMKALGYPRTTSHLEEHERMRAWIAEQRARAGSADAAKLLRDMAEHLVHWLYTHVLTIDMQYSEFFDEHRPALDRLLATYQGLRLDP